MIGKAADEFRRLSVILSINKLFPGVKQIVLPKRIPGAGCPDRFEGARLWQLVEKPRSEYVQIRVGPDSDRLGPYPRF